LAPKKGCPKRQYSEREISPTGELKRTPQKEAQNGRKEGSL